MADLAALQQEKSVLEREHQSIVASIHELRQKARKASIEAAACRQGVPEAQIKSWRNGIAKLQTELLEVQAKIASANKERRQARSKEPIKALSELPRNVVVKEEPPQRKNPERNGEVKPGRVLFLEFFFQLSRKAWIRDSLQPSNQALINWSTNSERPTARRKYRETQKMDAAG